MPIKDNARKALRQAKKRALANSKIKERFKNAVKAVKKAEPTAKELGQMLRDAQQAIDKAAKNGVIKKNTAARKVSRLMKQIAKAAKK